MPLLKYLLSNKLIKVGNTLMKTNDAGSEEEKLAPGLYDENNNLIKTWDQLLAEGLVTVSE